jgi:hypothetical protein
VWILLVPAVGPYFRPLVFDLPQHSPGYHPVSSSHAPAVGPYFRLVFDVVLLSQHTWILSGEFLASTRRWPILSSLGFRRGPLPQHSPGFGVIRTLIYRRWFGLLAPMLQASTLHRFTFGNISIATSRL